MTIESELQKFFESYLEAFEQRDAKAISELWEPVGLFPSPTGNFSMERKDFYEHCVGLLEFYKQQGVVKPTGKLRSVDELFQNVVQARMAYTMLDDKDNIITHWEHVYILRKSDDWLISLSIADEEMAAWQKLGAIS